MKRNTPELFASITVKFIPAFENLTELEELGFIVV